MKTFQLLFDADKGNGGGEGGNQLSAEILQKFKEFVEKKGGGNDNLAAQLLYNDNYELRRELREAKAKIPVDGAVILDPEQAKQWSAYQALGAPEVLDKAVKDLSTTQGELSGLRKSETLRTVAEVTGWKPTVLATLDTAEGGLEYEVRSETKDGKTVRAVYVKGGKAKDATPLTDYALTNWADHMPALATTTPNQRGTQFVAQGTGGADSGTLTVEQIKKQKLASGDYTL